MVTIALVVGRLDAIVRLLGVVVKVHQYGADVQLDNGDKVYTQFHNLRSIGGG